MIIYYLTLYFKLKFYLIKYDSNKFRLFRKNFYRNMVLSNKKIIILIFCETLPFIAISPIDIPIVKLSEVYLLPMNQHYQKNRIPLMFESSRTRPLELERMIKRKQYAQKYKPIEIESVEEDRKSKCGIEDFHYIREIAYNYNHGTLLKWESCENLEVEVKRAKLDGRENDSKILVKERVERWNSYLLEDLEKVIHKPVPKLVNKILDSSVQEVAEEYHKVLMNHLYDGIFMSNELAINEVPNINLTNLWINRVIDEFNSVVYGEKIPSDEKKKLIENNMKTLNALYLSYELAYMTGEIFLAFPSKSQEEENQFVLNKIKESSKIILNRLNIGNFPIQKKLLDHAESCLEQWSDWHKKNLRMAYYYNFYYHYSHFKDFSDGLKRNPKYWKIAKSTEEKILSSDVFRYRLEVVVRDACMTAFKSQKEIESSF